MTDITPLSNKDRICAKAALTVLGALPEGLTQDTLIQHMAITAQMPITEQDGIALIDTLVKRKWITSFTHPVIGDHRYTVTTQGLIAKGSL